MHGFIAAHYLSLHGEATAEFLKLSPVGKLDVRNGSEAVV